MITSFACSALGAAIVKSVPDASRKLLEVERYCGAYVCLSVPVIVHVCGAGLRDTWCVTAWTVAHVEANEPVGPGRSAFVGMDPHELGHVVECPTRPVIFVPADPPLDEAVPSL